MRKANEGPEKSCNFTVHARMLLKSGNAISFVVLALFLASCGGRSAHDATGGRNLSPHETGFGTIAMYASRSLVESSIGPLKSFRAGNGDELCTWRPGKKIRDMEGIEDVVITFRDGVVKGIRVNYGQIFDVQYKGVNKMVRERYGPPGDVTALDTINCSWRYDSLTVDFLPNRKQHWTGSFYVYTPVIRIVETLPEGNGAKPEE